LFVRLLYALEDEEIFLCEVPNNEQKWYRAEDMSNELRQKHISNIKFSDNANSCNTDTLNSWKLCRHKLLLSKGHKTVLTAFLGGISDFFAGHKNVLCPGIELKLYFFLM
jgi:hypothetical protein